jgi:hypothetical protein
MIGVIADPADHDVVREFFELFKTPWEFCSENRQYDVLLVTGTGKHEGVARVTIFYGSKNTLFDGDRKVSIGRQRKDPCFLSSHKLKIPVYGESVTFVETRDPLLQDVDSQECVGYLDYDEDRVLARVGYDLFREVRHLLTEGQPASNASSPALELHIELLRNLVTGCGISLVEIPPVPEGAKFIACLTHDVDHPSIRSHKWDHTGFGFLYRAIWGSLARLIHGELQFREVFGNWAAALKLPFVYAGIAKDFWRDFDDGYLALEGGLPSTFFVIPFKGDPGQRRDGSAPMFRASGYGAKDIAGALRNLMNAGDEIGLHGIDAWRDNAKGVEELREIQGITRIQETGIRMHWLYYDQQSPTMLERAGLTFDSTIGYNETIGYKAGTTQVYKPLNAEVLLELPMHVMDTALFYPNYLALSSEQAAVAFRRMLDNALQFGGCLTVNWHDRSILPERMWDRFYRHLIQEMRGQGAWFATAGQAVSWFKRRRSAEFEMDPDTGDVRIKPTTEHSDGLPGLHLRVHQARKAVSKSLVPDSRVEGVC